jgi:hypothetical protein
LVNPEFDVASFVQQFVGGQRAAVYRGIAAIGWLTKADPYPRTSLNRVSQRSQNARLPDHELTAIGKDSNFALG